MVNLSFAEKAARIKLVITDIDGVWTDATMYYSAEGEHMKSFSAYDGMGVQLAREAGMEVAIMTGENSGIVKARADKLRITHLFLGEKDKAARLNELCNKLALTPQQVAYIGDDVNDLEVLENAGLSALACNSPILNRFTPDYVTVREGGKGAFRDFVDQIIAARNGSL